MPLYNYIQYLESSDLTWFSNYNDLPIKFIRPRIKLLEDSMTKIFGQILEFTEDFEVIERFEMTHKLMKLENKYNAVTLILNALYAYPPTIGKDKFEELFEQLSKWNYKIDTTKPIFDQLDKIRRRIRGILSEIESLKIKLQTKNKVEKIEIEEIILNTELSLELKYRIEPKKTTLHEWLVYQKNAKKRIEQLKKAQRNGTNSDHI